MADRYWVGGTASWDGTAGTKWATTSGGTGGASVPTSADDVFFDANSGTGTVTIATGNTGAKSVNFTGFTGTLAGSAALTVSGNVTLSTGMTRTWNGNLNINASSTITSNGKSFAFIALNGVGITVQLADALTCTDTLSVDRATFTTNNFNVTASSFLQSTGSNARTLNFGSSTLTLGNINFTNATNLTLNAGTSQINLTNGGSQLSGISSGLTFYNVSFTSTSTSGTRSILGLNTFNNLSITAPSSAGVAQVTFSDNQTINGTLSTTGTAGNRRVWFRSDTYGIQRTLTVNSAPSLTDADFRDIIVNGTAAPISGTRIGNRGACSGITFDAPKTVYWNKIFSGNFADGDAWATSSGGTVSADNFPLPQDMAIFDDTGLFNNVTIFFNNTTPYASSINSSSLTRITTFSFSGAGVTCYGSIQTGSAAGVTYGGTTTLTFSGEGTKTITSAGKTFTCPITVDAYGGTVELADALNIGSQTLTVTNGTFDTKNYNVTAGGLVSSNSNVRFIKLGSSTLTLSGLTAINASTSTNLTFDAGTSQINATASSNTTIDGGNQTFYNVSFTGTSLGNRQITGSNTFNNLVLNASATGITNLVLWANQTVNGTLTVAGSSATQRAFVRSDTIGTTRTITANAISANDCDFRDITIAGSAAGASPTRAGDCGGNSGINFPAPKTVYRVGTNTGWADANSWATSSGGTGLTENFPLAQDTAIIDNNTALSGTLNLGILAAYNAGAVDCSARTNALTLNYNNTFTFYGSHTLGSGITVSGTSTQTFSGRGTQTFTSAGKTITFPITVDSFSGNFQLGDALNNTSFGCILNSGTFDAVSYNVTMVLFAGTGSTVRTLKMGSGLWTITGTGFCWNLGTITNLTFLKNTADILLSDTSTTARTFQGGGLSYNKLTIGGTTGTSTTTISGNNQFTELASTKTVAHTIALGTTAQTFGKWSVTGSAGNVVTLTGTGTGHTLAGSCTSGIDYLAMGSIGFAATSTAEFYAGANSTGTAAAPVYRTAKPADSTRYWVGGTGNWSDTARWSTSSGGSSGASVPRSHDDVVFDSASNATAYTATVDAVTGGVRCKSLTIAPPATGNITLAGSTAIVGIHGDVTLPATGLTRTFTSSIVLSGSTTGKTFTTNGVALNSSITVNGVGCGWTLGSALNNPNGNLTVTNGSFATSNFSLTTSSLNSNNSNTRSITLGSSTVTISNQTALSLSLPGLTWDAGTSTLVLTNFNLLFNGLGLTYYNVTVGGTLNEGHTINGDNTFNNLTFVNRANNGTNFVDFGGNQTINGTFSVNGTNTTRWRRFWLKSTVPGTQRTISAANVTGFGIDFSDIIATGAASWNDSSRTNSWGDGGGNSGITFSPGRNAYWNLSGTQDWFATAWALTNNGTPNVANYPLIHDTAVFTEAGAVGTVRFDSQRLTVGSITMADGVSNRVSPMTLNFGFYDGEIVFGSITFFNNLTITGGGTTPGGSSRTLTFAGYNKTQTFNTAGKALPIGLILQHGFNNVVQLQGALTLTSRDMYIRNGEFDANGYNVTAYTLDASYATPRAIKMGSGLWTITGPSSVWNFTNTANLTFVKGTADILLSDTSTTSRTFAGGGLSYNKLTIGGATGTSTLTINQNNTFTEIASTKTVAHTIALGTTSQRVGAFTVTGTSGNVVTITGNTSNLIYTGSGAITDIDYLNVQGRVYGSAGQITDVWYAGANSVNSGSLGWVFAAGVTPPPAANANFFLMFG